MKTSARPGNLLSNMETLADATRLRLLWLLERHELGVVELCDVVQLPQSTVSRHLKILLDGGWVRPRKQGTTHLYRMIQDELDPAARKLWLLAREQTEPWATVQQDQLRLSRRLRDRQQGARQFFAGAAQKWDKLRAQLYGERFNIDAMLALLPRDLVVADLGCGTARLAAELAPRVAKVIAVDNSPAMLKAARKRAAHLDNVEVHDGDLDQLLIESATCDAAMLLLVLSYVPEPPAVLREMSRILKPSGKAIIVDLLPHDREEFRREMGQVSLGFDPPQLQQMLHDAGFTSANIHPLVPEPAAKGPALFLATAAR